MGVPASNEDDPGGPDFDADLDRIIREDRELLDRLAFSGDAVEREKTVAPEQTDEDDPGGPDFDADLDEVLTKNAELYRRLAR